MTDHSRICAWLHVLSGVAVMLLLSASLAYLASHYSSSNLPEQVKALLGGAGVAIGTAICLVAGVELIGGVAFLSGKALGRPLLLLSSTFQLINLPIGTALGLYTYWALMKAKPEVRMAA
jgi:hypothetical protein